MPANPVFNAHRTQQRLRKKTKLRISRCAALALAAALEYLCAEMLLIAGENILLHRYDRKFATNQNAIIVPYDLQMALMNDDELVTLIKRERIFGVQGAGVVSFILYSVERDVS